MLQYLSCVCVFHHHSIKTEAWSARVVSWIRLRTLSSWQMAEGKYYLIKQRHVSRRLNISGYAVKHFRLVFLTRNHTMDCLYANYFLRVMPLLPWLLKMDAPKLLEPGFSLLTKSWASQWNVFHKVILRYTLILFYLLSENWLLRMVSC